MAISYNTYIQYISVSYCISYVELHFYFVRLFLTAFYASMDHPQLSTTVAILHVPKNAKWLKCAHTLNSFPVIENSSMYGHISVILHFLVHVIWPSVLTILNQTVLTRASKVKSQLPVQTSRKSSTVQRFEHFSDFRGIVDVILNGNL